MDKCKHGFDHACLNWAWQEQQKRIDNLERRLKAVDALSQMRAAALTAFKHVDMNAEIKRKILILKKAERALKGGEV